MAKTGRSHNKRKDSTGTISKVITYGTFDCLHPGHIRLLKRAKTLGDYLIVGLSTDAFNTKKGKTAVLNYKQRKEVLEAIEYVDEVIPEKNWQQKEKETKGKIFVMGSDWKGEFDRFDCIYLPRTRGISTTMIKENYERRISYKSRATK